jgi:lysozyme
MPNAARVTRVSQRGLDLIKKYEGFSAHAYKPVPGEKFWTVGYGHYGPDVHPTTHVTLSHATRLLRADVRDAERAVDRLVKVPINQNRFDALVSLCYNIGSGAFAGSTVLRELNRRHYVRAALGFGMWVRGANGRLPGLVKRRAAEARLFRKKVKK